MPNDRHQNVVTTSATNLATPCLPLHCSFHILKSTLIHDWTDTWQHGIYWERRFLSCHKQGTKKKFWAPMRNRISDLRIDSKQSICSKYPKVGNNYLMSTILNINEPCKCSASKGFQGLLSHKWVHNLNTYLSSLLWMGKDWWHHELKFQVWHVREGYSSSMTNVWN